MPKTFVNDGNLDHGVDAGSITASPWAFVITPGAAQLINASHRILLTPRSSAEKPGGRVEGVLPHVIDPQTLSLHLPGGVVRELARRQDRACEGVLAITFGLFSELVLRGIVVATTPTSEAGSKAAENPGFLRVAFRVTFLAIVTETVARRDLAWREAGRTISQLNQLEMEGVLARCSQ